MRIALITGASSGLGAEFARQIDKNEKNIDAIWLLARRQDRLETLAKTLNHPSKVIPADLTKPETFTMLEKKFKEENIQVGILVNSAGYGKLGDYKDISREDSDGMINLNCRGAVNITLSCIPFMESGDRIIQICSVAGFQPLQQINIYAASKSFLYNYTRALRMELLPRKISVLAVCPYWIRDTEFIGIAEGKKEKTPVRHFPMATKSEHVVKSALRCSRMGLAVCTPDPISFLDRIFSKLLPRQVMIYIWELLRKI